MPSETGHDVGRWSRVTESEARARPRVSVVVAVRGNVTALAG